MVLKKYELEAKLKDENQLIQSGVLREENPLDLSDEFKEFLEACRRGDLRTCQELISLGVNINGKDRFDYTPLIVVSYSSSLLTPRTRSGGPAFEMHDSLTMLR